MDAATWVLLSRFSSPKTGMAGTYLWAVASLFRIQETGSALNQSLSFLGLWRVPPPKKGETSIPLLTTQETSKNFPHFNTPHFNTRHGDSRMARVAFGQQYRIHFTWFIWGHWAISSEGGLVVFEWKWLLIHQGFSIKDPYVKLKMLKPKIQKVSFA